ncbi:hypothetical protein [Actinomycetospora termitidis]|uniref:Uncharacterized protein n=1 Tax=Actinomycetospora termitidis TaxID=3053470 RepID=A0ABT7MFM8_9PSEU|nr:hypothetical protein [Actinomycetospora sp. Odt1-22]MDL5159468.1 hypothetical protein [Actinomycetospora sp. Odt1-22]
MTVWTEDDWDTMVDLLELVAATDRRTISELDVRTWLAIAQDAGWPSADFARRAIIRFRNERPGVWLEPGHITQAYRELRQEARDCYQEPDVPNEVLRGSHAEYQAFMRQAATDHHARYLAAWIEGHQGRERITAALRSADLRAISGGAAS